MIDSYDLYQSFLTYVNTYCGGFYRPQTDFIRALNDESYKFWVEQTGKAEKSQEVMDNLAPFLLSANRKVSQSQSYYGTFQPPDDYGRFASSKIVIHNNKTVPDPNVCDGKCDGLEDQEEKTEKYLESLIESTVEKIDNQRWDAVCKHLTKRPTFDNPKVTQIDKGFKVAPRTVGVIVLNYYREPKPATFVYTISPGNTQTGAGDQIIYDKNNSKPLEWPNNLRNEFVCRLGVRYGLFTRDAFVANIANMQASESK